MICACVTPIGKEGCGPRLKLTGAGVDRFGTALDNSIADGEAVRT
jgi:hypothetical protein